MTTNGPGQRGKPGRPRSGRPLALVRGRLRVSLYLSPQAVQKLDLHATAETLDRSEMVETLIHKHLTRFQVIDTAAEGEAGAGEGAPPADAKPEKARRK